MALDSNIALQTKLPTFDNPLTQYAQVAAIQQAQNQNQLAQYTISKAQRDDADTLAQRNLLTGANGDLEAGYNALLKGGYLDKAMAIKKAQLEQQKSQADIGHVKAQTAESGNKVAVSQHEQIGQTLGALAQVPTGATPEMVSNAMKHLVDIGVVNPEMATKVISGVPQDPAAMKAWLLQGQAAVMKAPELMKYTTVDANTAANNRTVIATTGMNNATSIKTTGMNNRTSIMTTDMNNDVSRSNNADTIRSTQAINGIGPDGAPSENIETMAKAIAEGRQAPLTGFALAKPQAQQIMARVMALNPNFDGGDFAAKSNALKGFSTGKEGTALRSFNVASVHLDTLSEMGKALNNGDMQLFNKIANTYKEQTGNAAPTNFDGVKEIVAKEVVKAIVAGGGGVDERKELAELLSKAKSPAQIQGVITHFKELMEAQKAGLMDQYQRTTGRDDGETVFAPSKKPAQQVAEAVKGGESARLAAAKPVSIRTAEDYAKLPPGTVYTAPDGSQRTKK